jgi:hypothetical protein
MTIASRHQAGDVLAWVGRRRLVNVVAHGNHDSELLDRDGDVETGSNRFRLNLADLLDHETPWFG